VQGACYDEPPKGWPGEALKEGQCIIRTLDDLFRFQGSRTASSAGVEPVLISNLYLLREVFDDAGRSNGGRGGGFATLVQSTAAAMYLHRLTLDGGRLDSGMAPERGRGLHSLSSITLSEGVLLLLLLQFLCC
jgi:hypothetical protein